MYRIALFCRIALKGLELGILLAHFFEVHSFFFLLGGSGTVVSAMAFIFETEFVATLYVQGELQCAVLGNMLQLVRGSASVATRSIGRGTFSNKYATDPPSPCPYKREAYL